MPLFEMIMNEIAHTPDGPKASAAYDPAALPADRNDPVRRQRAATRARKDNPRLSLHAAADAEGRKRSTSPGGHQRVCSNIPALCLVGGETVETAEPHEPEAVNVSPVSLVSAVSGVLVPGSSEHSQARRKADLS